MFLISQYLLGPTDMAKVQLEERNHQKKPRVFLLILMEPSNGTRYAPFSPKVDKCQIKNNSIILFSSSTGLIKKLHQWPDHHYNLL